MIDIQITGNLPSINTDLAPAMERIAERMYSDVVGEFDSSGYGRWAATRDGKAATLGGSGGLIAGSVTKEFNETSATVTAMNTIHQRGGMILATDKQRRFLFATHPEWRGKSGATGQGMILRYPVRTYVTFVESFFEFAKQELGNHIFKVSESTN
jgi:phage gpG-like protein